MEDLKQYNLTEIEKKDQKIGRLSMKRDVITAIMGNQLISMSDKSILISLINNIK